MLNQQTICSGDMISSLGMIPQDNNLLSSSISSSTSSQSLANDHHQQIFPPIIRSNLSNSYFWRHNRGSNISSRNLRTNKKNRRLNSRLNCTDDTVSNFENMNSSNNHSVCLMNGFQTLKLNRILCDVTLVAQGKRFDVHKVIMASCSDYFRSMFTGGMKESQQNVIELKAVSAQGLEKLIEIIYTSSTDFESQMQLFDVISAASHLQCLLVIEYCEKSLVKKINVENFNMFVQMAQLYRMENALRDIDLFIMNNLTELIEMTNEKTVNSLQTLNKETLMGHESLSEFNENENSKALTYDQLHRCLIRNDLRIKEIDLFLLTWKWINNSLLQDKCRLSRISKDIGSNENSLKILRSKKKINLIRSLMKQIRFTLISPADLVNRVQGINRIMTNDTFLRHLVIKALNYHVMPTFQASLFREANVRRISNLSRASSDLDNSVDSSDDNDEAYRPGLGADSNRYSLNMNMRSPVKSILTIGGREINPSPSLHDKCYLINNYILSRNLSIDTDLIQPADKRIELSSLPNALSHMQSVVVQENFLYILGGCTSQCAHGESAVSTVHRYDPRLNAWISVKSMQTKRAYFYACVLHVNESHALESPSYKRKLAEKQFIYAIGGKNKEGALCSVERYDMTTNSWQYVRSLPSAYYAHSGCVSNNMLYVTGGYTHGQFTADLYCYSPNLDQWHQLRQMNSPRGWHCMCVANDNLYVFGGCYLNSNIPVNSSNNPANMIPGQNQNQIQPQTAQPVLCTEFYSIKSDCWNIVRPMLNLHKEASCFLLNNSIFVLGGYNIQAKTGQRVISKYDFSNDLWETVGQQHLPAGITGMGLAVIDIPWFMIERNENYENEHKKDTLSQPRRDFNYSYLYDSETDSDEVESNYIDYDKAEFIDDKASSSFDGDYDESNDGCDYHEKKHYKFSKINHTSNISEASKLSDAFKSESTLCTKTN